MPFFLAKLFAQCKNEHPNFKKVMSYVAKNDPIAVIFVV